MAAVAPMESNMNNENINLCQILDIQMTSLSLSSLAVLTGNLTVVYPVTHGVVLQLDFTAIAPMRVTCNSSARGGNNDPNTQWPSRGVESIR